MPSPDSGSSSAPSRHTTGSIAATLRAELIGPSHLPISGLAAIDGASRGDLTFIRSSKFAAHWARSAASGALVTRGVEVHGHDPSSRALIIVDNADVAMVTVLRLFMPPKKLFQPGIHPTAIVDPSATIGHGVHVGPHCIVGADCTIGDGSVLVAHVFLGDEVSIGSITTLHPGVRVLDRCTIGNACELWPNTVIGADGFGYVPSPDRQRLLKIPLIGTVEIGDAVEIGACSAVDRGKFGPTIVGDGTKIDNHCQIGHNVTLGRCVIICGVTGIGGSTTVGDGVVIAGHVGVADNLTVGAGATLLAKSGVFSHVPPGETWFGSPAGPYKDQMRSYAALRRLSDHLRRVNRLEKAAGSKGTVPSEPDNPDDD